MTFLLCKVYPFSLSMEIKYIFIFIMFLLNSVVITLTDDDDIVEDAMSLHVMIVPSSRRSARTHRVRRMAQSLLSPFYSQPQIRQSAIPMDLKEATTLVFNTNMKPRYCL